MFSCNLRKTFKDTFFTEHLREQYVLQLSGTLIGLYPFQTEKHIFYKYQCDFNIITYTHSFCTFNKKNPTKNRYTKNQPIHFSMTPKIWIFFKNFFQNLKS